MTTLQGGALFAHLQARPGLVALVGDRVYPRKMPPDPVFPLVLYTRVSTPPRGLTHSGPVGLAEPRIQFDVWATDPLDADAVAEQLRLAVHGFRGSMDDVVVGSAQVVNDFDADDPDTGLFRRVLDAQIQHEEAVA